MLRNNLLALVVNYALGIGVFLLSVFLFFGSFTPGSGQEIVTGIGRIFYTVAIVLISLACFFVTGSRLKSQESRVKNLLSVMSPLGWSIVLYAVYLINMHIDKAIPLGKSFAKTFSAIMFLSTYHYPVIFITGPLNVLIERIMLVMLSVIPSLVMWLGMEWKSKMTLKEKIGVQDTGLEKA